MATFPFISSSRVVRPHNSCSNKPLLSSNGRKPRLQVEKLLPLRRFHRNLSVSFSVSCNFSTVVHIARSGSRRNCWFVAKVSRNRQENNTHLESSGKPNFGRRGRRFSLRLRPRLRLLSMRLKRFSFRYSMDDIVNMLIRNSRKVTVSTAISFAMGLIFLFLKFTAVPASKVVPYSDLISNLRSGQVTTVLFEEGSRRIFYNTVSNDDESKAIDVPSGRMLESSASAISLGGKTASATPKWKYATRKIDHDEKFLLDLMREKGTMYSSAPQSALMAMRNILITIISLWIPLMPLMWLLYRQLSAANSPAKKRRPTNQKVNFDDVKGVDAAKEELMEVRFNLHLILISV